VGVMPKLHAGMNIHAQAEKTEHPQYGPQIKIISYTTHAPQSDEGLKIFLQEMVWGIGPSLAARIVAKFGSETPEKMSSSKALMSVSGIGEKKAKDIAESWTEHESERIALEGILQFLTSNDLPTGHARKIFNAWGFGAAETLTENPYQLTEIRGIGFKIADRIALASGFSPTCPERTRAALIYTVTQVTISGHCFMPRKELLAATQTDLLPQLSHAAINKQLQQIISQKHPELVNDNDHIYPWPLHNAEIEAARRIVRLCSENSRLAEIDTSTPENGICYTQQQSDAIRSAFEQKISIITGGPGTGKTTLVNAITTIAKKNNIHVQLASPTGKAAKRLSQVTGCPASTIHRLIGTQPDSHQLLHNKENPLPGDIIIIDEASMIDIRLARNLLNAIRPDAHLVLVGDMDQLPSVGPGNVLRDLIQSAEESPTIHLTKLNTIHRQSADSEIITNAHRINAGEMPKFYTNGNGGDFYLFKTATAKSAADRVVDLVTERIPRAFGYAPDDIQVLTPIHAGAAGDNMLNTRLQNALNPIAGRQILTSFNREFRVGDRVIQTKNDYKENVFNGDQGVVVKIGKNPKNKDKPTAWIQFDTLTIPYTKTELAYVNLAYALTVHKSQGSEYPCVVVTALTQHYIMLQRNLLYTAVTRARELVVIVGNRRALGIAVQNNKVGQRNTNLAARIKDVTNITRL